jgi:hypothetical protein
VRELGPACFTGWRRLISATPGARQGALRCGPGLAASDGIERSAGGEGVKRPHPGPGGMNSLGAASADLAFPFSRATILWLMLDPRC